MKLPSALTRLIALVAAAGIADTLTMTSAVVSLPFFKCSHVRKATIIWLGIFIHLNDLNKAHGSPNRSYSPKYTMNGKHPNPVTVPSTYYKTARTVAIMVSMWLRKSLRHDWKALQMAGSECLILVTD